jgi:uncharacterized protein YbgA (DUF1722 family)
MQVGSAQSALLENLMDHLKQDLSGKDKQELLGLIEDYRQGLPSLIVPLTLLNHHLNRCRNRNTSKCTCIHIPRS